MKTSTQNGLFMKKRASAFLVSLFAAIGVISFGVVSKGQNSVAKEAVAASDIETYYSTINGSGSSLLTSINTKIKNPDWVGYSGLKAAYAVTDKLTNTKLYDIYSDVTNYAPGSDFSGNYQNPGDGYNREHTIPQSWWNDGTSQQGCDLFIVLPSDAKINGMRSNYPYGITTSGASWKVTGDTYTNRLGSSTSTQYVSGTVFEPFDNRKGDLARTYFYAVACYLTSGGGSGKASTWTYGDGSKVFSSSGNNGFVQKYLDMLLKWHHDDPVSDWEISRNTKVQNQQSNRNPFIDHPSWVDLIWGGTYPSTGANWEDTSAGSVVNGKLTPSVGITSISKTSVALTAGQSTTISATSSNSGTISWSSSNTSVATVSSASAASGSNVTINAVAASNTPVTITASITISGQTYSKTCSVTVNEYVPQKLATPSLTYNNSTKKVSWTNVANATSYQVKVDNGSYATASSPYDVSGLSTGVEHTVYVVAKASGYTDSDPGSTTFTPTSGGGGGETTYTLVQSNSSLSNGDKVVLTTIQTSTPITGVTGWNGNSDATVSTTSSNWLEYTVTDASSDGWKLKTGDVYIASPTGNHFKHGATGGTVSVDGEGHFVCNSRYLCINNNQYYRCYTAIGSYTPFYIYQVSSSGSSPTLTGITLNTSNVKKNFTINDVFTYSGLVVTANYSDTSSEIVSSGYSVSTPDLTTTGNKTVTVTYSGKSAEYQITVAASPVTSISATVSKTYYVGETISASDITVKDSNNNDVTDFTFDNDGYKFDYEDAASGGALTNKTFHSAVEYGDFSCNLTVQVQRKARVTPQQDDDVLNQTFTGVTGSSYVSFSNKTGTSGVVYAGQCAGGNSSIQLRSKSDDSGNYSGVIATSSSKTFKKVTVVWESGTASGRTLNVYGSNTAYSSANDLYSSLTDGDLLGTIVYGTSTELTITGDYLYIGLRSANSAMYLTSVTISYGSGSDTALNLSNYIMYEDTNNQCTSKFTTAKGYFEGLTSSERSTFMTSDDYVISTARERFEAWARHEGKSINYSNGDYAISNASRINILVNSTVNNSTIVVVVVVGIATLAVGGYFLLRKKKEN